MFGSWNLKINVNKVHCCVIIVAYKVQIINIGKAIFEVLNIIKCIIWCMALNHVNLFSIKV